MTNPYAAPAIVNYNVAPPPDDGSQTVANTISWNGNGGTAGVKAKLADPIKVYVDAVNSAVNTALGKVVDTDPDVSNAIAGALGFTETVLGIASGIVTATRSAHAINTSGGSSDVLTSITAGASIVASPNALLFIRRNTSGQQITVKHGTGNIFLNGGADVLLIADQDYLALVNRGSNWYQVGGNTLANSSTGSTSTSGSFYQPQVGIDFLQSQLCF